MQEKEEFKEKEVDEEVLQKEVEVRWSSSRMTFPSRTCRIIQCRLVQLMSVTCINQTQWLPQPVNTFH